MIKIFVDTETTGFDPIKDDIHQIGAVCGNKHFQINLKFNRSKVKHNLPIPDDIMRFDSLEAVKMFIVFLTECKQTFNVNEKFIFAGKNTKFDWLFLEQLFKQCGFSLFDYFHYTPFDLESVLIFAKDLDIIPYEQSIKLEEIVKYYGLRGTVHEALSDAYNTQKIYNILLKKFYLLKEDSEILSNI